MSRICEMQGKLFLCQYIEEREGYHHQQNTHNNREKCQEQCFRNKLYNKFSPARPKYFPDTHFFGAFLTPGGSEVHKIYAGEEKDNPGDHTEHVYILDTTASRKFAILKIPSQVPVIH